MNDTTLKDFDPVHAAANGYTKEDWDEVSDNPEWTVEDFASARPFTEVFPQLADRIRSSRDLRNRSGRG